MKFGLGVGFIRLSKTWFINRNSLKIFSEFYEHESIYNHRLFVGFGISVLTTSGQLNFPLLLYFNFFSIAYHFSYEMDLNLQQRTLLKLPQFIYCSS